ncbi:DNA-binding response regulator [Insulibacter thermoxylanivorax]|uniref:DNA-binding response regulator n=2 Tax=Insulibacter thermoxylanivorax TaxID=2749268 RepID=A0A916Q9U8_9BACL|nr:response regulator transcription factor [Insulibacter thermoxylanivorax]GFR36850.1 DNA-binding response regulator [Insulibacter thermoxylanivorax]
MMNNEKQLHILVVDDEERIRRLLRMYLEKEGFLISEAKDGETALQMALDQDYDCILLDLMLPNMDGIDVCSKLRQTKNTPVIMLTARGEESNRVQGFEVGADDYVVKPFSPREVIYRVKAVLRRTAAGAAVANDNRSNNIVFPHLVIEHDAHRVTAGGVEVNLTPKEYELLHYLASSPDKVFSREQLLKDVWNYEFFGDLRTVDTHIKRLREKLTKSSPEAAAMITTVWGVGYKLEVPKE